MNDIVMFHLVVERSLGSDAWPEQVLTDAREQLAGVGDFDRLHGGDDDHVEDGETVAERLRRLERASNEGELFAVVSSAPTRVQVRGVLSSWAEYHEQLFGLIYLAAAAVRAGDRAQLSVMGELDGELLIVLVDGSPDLSVRAEDPQNLDEDDWNSRLDGVAALEAEFQAWLDAR
jgi:hypothetical protein